MKAKDVLSNQIVYLTYVLKDFPDIADAEIFRPISDNLHQMRQMSDLPQAAQIIVANTEKKLARWLELRLTVSRYSVERVLMTLKLVMQQMNSSGESLA